MAANFITITVQDEGYFRKSFGIKPHMSVRKLIETYSRHLCGECTRPEMLEFWYEATKLDTQTARSLEMKDGDIVDVRVPRQSTRGACPVPLEQTLPNVHYISKAATDASSEIPEKDNVPQEPDRIEVKVRDPNGNEMVFKLKKDTAMIKVMKEFAKRVDKTVADCRFITNEGERVLPDHTPASLEMEDGDQIDVHWEMIGGSRLALT